jgi:hypothetical protein
LTKMSTAGLIVSVTISGTFRLSLRLISPQKRRESERE